MFEGSFKDPPDLHPSASEIPSRDNDSGTDLCCCCSQMQAGASPGVFMANLGLSRGSTQGFSFGGFSLAVPSWAVLSTVIFTLYSNRRGDWNDKFFNQNWLLNGDIFLKPCWMSFSLSTSLGCERIASCVFHLGAMSWQTSLLHLFSFIDGFFKVRLWSHRDTLN